MLDRSSSYCSTKNQAALKNNLKNKKLFSVRSLLHRLLLSRLVIGTTVFTVITVGRLTVTLLITHGNTKTQVRDVYKMLIKINTEVHKGRS